MDSLRDGMWKGEPAYVVGGGPSLRSFDWSLLRGKKHVIVINCAYKQVPDAEIWFSEDIRTIEQIFWKDPAWHDFKGLKVLHALNSTFAKRAREMLRVEVIERTRPDKYWSRSLKDGLALASNSGIGALSLAYILGADPIYLLGFDCRSHHDTEQNYHEVYERAGLDRTGAVHYESFRSDFDAWVAPHVRDRKIVNLIDPAFPSAIKSWPKVDWRDVLTGRTSELSDAERLGGKSLQASFPPA